MNNERIGLELHSLNNMIRRYFEFSSHKKEIDSITGNNGWIICYLADHVHQDIYQKDIEDHFTITKSTASKVLSLMEQKGLIQRMAVSQDARLKRIVLTERAWEVRDVIMKDVIKMETTLTSGFDPEEIRILQTYLQRMKENISDIQKENGGISHD